MEGLPFAFPVGMHAIRLVVILCLAVPAWAGDTTDQELEKLREENKKLAERVDHLERSALEESIDQYLEKSSSAGSAEGADSLVPGALKLRVSGQIRIRWEYRDRNYSPVDPQAAESFDVTFFRARLRFDLEVRENLAVVIELQDARRFGQAGSTVNLLGNVDLRRGYVEFKKIGGSDLSVEVGRYVMFYGDQRVIGHLEWANPGRTYDGFRGRYKKEKWWLDFFFAKVRETVVPDDDQDFGGLYGGAGIVEAYVLYLSNRQPTVLVPGDSEFWTLGVRLHDKPGNFDWTVEGQGQFGTVAQEDLEAFGVVVEGGYTIKNAGWKPRIGVIVAYATGDETVGDGQNEQLVTLFPTNHLHYGYIDFVGWSNIFDIELNARVQPAAGWAVELAYHHFQRPSDEGAWISAAGAVIRPGQAGTSSHLGDEVDFVVTWKPNKSLLLEAGYAVFFPGDFVKQTGASPTSHWFYFMILVRF